MIYKTSLDNVAKGVTIATTILFAAIIVGPILFSKDEGSSIPIFISIVLLLIYFGIFIFRPINYSLTDDNLIIHRPLTNVKIDRKEIKSVEQLDKEKLKWVIRTFGVGGLFGYWGKFANTQIGSMTWYATRRNNAVLITTIYNKKIVLTPNDPRKFVSEFNGQTL